MTLTLHSELYCAVIVKAVLYTVHCVSAKSSSTLQCTGLVQGVAVLYSSLSEQYTVLVQIGSVLYRTLCYSKE